MQVVIAVVFGLMLSASVVAEPLIEGRVRLDSGAPVANAQVRIFDMTDLRQGAIARATTDGTGYFALPLAALRGSALPTSFALGQNYPNPFNPSTIIPYQLTAAAAVRLEVFNLLGQRIATLVNEERSAGFHTATWHATDGAGRAVGAGVYIYRMTVAAESQTGRMVLIDGQAGVAAGGAASVLPGVSGGGGPTGASEEYGLIVSGRGLIPYADPAFRVEAGMAPVELVVSAGQYSAGKATDDDCALCDLFEFNDDDEGPGPSGKALATLDAPAAPTNLRFESVTDSSCTVRWDAAEGAADYDVNYKPAVGGKWTNEPHRGTRLYTTINDLEPGTEYRWAARAENSDGASEWVFGPNFTTLADETTEEEAADGQAPAAPTNLRVESVTGSSCTVRWDAAAGATDYDVNYKPAVGGKWTSYPHRGTGLYTTINDLEPGTEYRWAVRAENSDGRSEWVFGPNFTTLGADGQVTIPDARLRAAIARALGKASGATITVGQMKNLTSLDASRKGISDLTGLEFATNLTWLSLWGNNINTISDISALSGLTNLTFLQLSNNTIRDISPLRGLTNLEILALADNTIRDISPLSGLTNLPSLYLGNNDIRDISPLASLTNLRFLRLEENTISDISALSGLTNLRFLRLDGNHISDISALVSLTNLEEVWFKRNRLLNASSINEHIPALQARGVTVTFDPTPSTITITDDPTPVTIPDANLRAAIETALGKASGAAITKGEMTTLLTLEASEAGIRNLTGLEFATNLTFLDLWNNNLTGISSLASLTNLKILRLEQNTISDISSLAGLTNLTSLYLDGNNLTGISSLASLTNLTELYLGDNNLTDISPLASLTNLTILQLADNTISDVSALAGMTNLAWLDLLGNPLSASSINNHIPRLQDRRVDVQFKPNPFRGSDFDIELVFLGRFTDSDKNILRRAARRWMSIITEDLPDYKFAESWTGECGDQSYHIPSGEQIDDLRIYVTRSDGDFAGWGWPPLLREETHLPVLGCMAFNLARANLWITGLHEIGHVLGFGTIWDNLGLLQSPNGNTHFNGPRAIAAFNDAGGRNYTSAKVPVDSDLFHWGSRLFGDLMVSGGGGALSAITVQALADLGWVVDVTQADPYILPSAAAKASAKIAASSTHAEPEWSCGTGQHQEPIYVVDPQGRIVRTINP